MEPCKYCGASHGVRCPSISAIEYHPDGTVRRVEFVQPHPWVPTSYPQPMPFPSPTALPPAMPQPRWITGIAAAPQTAGDAVSAMTGIVDTSFILMNGAH